MVAKAVLYYDPASVWSRAALLTLQEKGYGKDELDLRVVDTTKGEEFSPAMLRLNPKGEYVFQALRRLYNAPIATVPILVVPLQGTLGVGVETRFKVIADPKALVDFLDRSRSATSRSSSTSTAPAPSLSPATVGFAATSNKVIDVVYSSVVAPELLSHYSSRDPQSRQALAASLVPTLVTRKQVLTTYLADCEREVIKMSDRTKALWNEKKHETDILLQQLGAGSGEHSDEYFAIVKQTWERAIPDALTKVNEEIIGPYIHGDQISIADIHLCAWLIHVVKLSGGGCAESGDVALTRVEQHTGATLPRDSRPLLPNTSLQSKLAGFWDAMKKRPSWDSVWA